MQKIVYCIELLIFISGILLLCSSRPTRFSAEEMKKIYTQAKGKFEYGKTEWKALLAESPAGQRLVKPWRKIHIESQEREIYEGISYLRNLICIGSEYRINGDYVLEELASLGGVLEKCYIRMLHYLRSNEKERALEYFVKAVFSDFASDYGKLLLQWDESEPESLLETLQLYQCGIREKQVTSRKKQDEIISDLVYLPVVVNVMVVLVNFVYVAYFLDQKQMLLTMF